MPDLRWREATRGAATFSLVLIASCSFAPEPRTPTVVVDLPPEYPAEVADSTGAAAAAADSLVREPERWWTVYNDPVLEALVDTPVASG